MSKLIIAALAALCAVSANAKGFGYVGHMPKMPDMHVPHAVIKEPKGPHEHALRAKHSSAENALKSIDDIADSIIPGDAPMVGAKYASH